MDSDKIKEYSVAFIATEEKPVNQLNWLSGKDWFKAKGHWIIIRQITKHGPVHRSLLAEDYVPFEEYSQSGHHSFIFLD